MKISDLKHKMSTWYNGEPFKNSPGDNFFFFGNVYKPSALRVRKVVDYTRKEHKFLVGTILTITAIVVAVLAL